MAKQTRTKNNKYRDNQKRQSRNARNCASYETERDTDERRSKSSNDPSWYAADKALLRDSASIPFAESIGTPVSLHPPYDLEMAGENHATNQGAFITVPGIMTLSISPSIGYSSDRTSPANVAATSMYTFVRKANSGSANYDATDMMMYTLAMSNIYAYLVYLQRIYGAASLYSHRNRYMPTALLNAMGVNASDVQSNMSAFRYGINILINKAASFIVPSTIPLFYRYSFLYRDVYTEGESVKDQMYMYVPASFWRYEWDPGRDYRGMCRAYAFPNSTEQSGVQSPLPRTGLLTVQELLDFGEFLMQNLLGDEDVNIMCGDILKAFGEGNVIKLQQLDTYYPLVPKYDKSVLEQIKNATVVFAYPSEVWTGSSVATKVPIATYAWDISQEIPVEANSGNAYLVHKPHLEYTVHTDGDNEYIRLTGTSVEYASTLRTYTEDRFITTNAFEATPEIVAENTRLMVIADPALAQTGKVEVSPRSNNLLCNYPLVCGSDVCVGCRAYFFNVATEGTVSTTLENVGMKYVEYMTDKYSNQQLVSITNELMRLSAFKFRPCISMLLLQGAQPVNASAGDFEDWASITNENYYFDLDNYTTIDASELRRIHEAALMNLLHVPSISRI